MKVLGRRERIETADARVLVVVGDEPERARAGFLHGLEIPWPVLVDPELGAYAAWGLGRISPLRMVTPGVVVRYARLLRKGERLQRPGHDALQLGGDFVVGRDGRLAYSHPQTGPDDRPPTATLVAELERASAK